MDDGIEALSDDDEDPAWAECTALLGASKKRGLRNLRPVGCVPSGAFPSQTALPTYSGPAGSAMPDLLTEERLPAFTIVGRRRESP